MADLLDAEIEEQFLLDSGLLEPGQPTRLSTFKERIRLEAEFTPQERRIIRALVLGYAAENVRHP